MINLNNITFSYKSGLLKKKPGKVLFDHLDLQMQAGEGQIYGLLGKNGAGKTTLLKLISGLVFPDGGAADVMGHVPSERHPAMLADIYYVQEELYLPEIKISAYEKFYAPFYPKFSVEQFDYYLKEFELDKSSKIHNLSHGQKKKAMLSFGMACNCRLLILDEPTNGLDIPSKSLFRKMIANAISEDRLFIISTHQVKDVANLIDPIIILEDGKILFNESVERISQKLSFDLEQGLAEPQDALFSERIPGGYKTVRENKSGNESEIDLEALFNTIVMNQEKINHLFQKELQYESN